jgi:16S rRNA (guanine527-N7)-methyltransferase
LAARYGLPESAVGQFQRLLSALETEPDPPTTIRRAEEAVTGHVADSLSALELEELRGARRIADVGSGAGFPGLALAIALTEAQVYLLESQGRKTAVIDRLRQAADVTNARSVTARVEEWARNPPPLGGREAYDAVTARAVAPLAVLAEYASPLLRESGVLVAWKGARDASEEAAASKAADKLGMQLREVLRVQPFAGARERHLHVLAKAAATPEGFPRRPGMARKRPLG